MSNEEAIRNFHLLSLHGALKQEVKEGVKRSKGLSPSQEVKRMLGLRRGMSKQRTLDQLEVYLRCNGILNQ